MESMGVFISYRVCIVIWHAHVRVCLLRDMAEIYTSGPKESFIKDGTTALRYLKVTYRLRRKIRHKAGKI